MSLDPTLGQLRTTLDDIKKHVAKINLNSALPLASKSMVPNMTVSPHAVTATANKILIPLIRRIMPTVMAQHIIGTKPNKNRKETGLFVKPFEFMPELKPRKGRRGQPHWRELRIHLLLERFAALREALTEAYLEAHGRNSWYLLSSQEWNFWTWCKIELEKHNISVVYDIEYESHALHAASDTDLVAFLLIWQGQKLANLEQ